MSLLLEPFAYSYMTNAIWVSALVGAVCAFLCSAHAGYIAGQNVLVDGGNYPGTF